MNAEVAEEDKLTLFGTMRWFLRVCWSAADRFYWDNGFARASSLAYTSILSIVPFFALGFGMLASFAVSARYAEGVQDFVLRKFVPAPEVAEQILDILRDLSSGINAISIPMILFFVFTSLVLINSIESALNEIWQVYEPRPILQRVGIFCTIVLALPVLALATYFFYEIRLRGYLVQKELGHYLLALLPLALVIATFAFVFHSVPKARVHLKSAVIGALVTAVLFLTAHWGFAHYIAKYASYNKLYGALAGIPIFLVWLYLFWMVVLFGAEVSYQAQYLPRTGKLWRRTVHSVGDGEITVAAQVLVTIARRFMEGEPLPSETELAENLGCSSVVLRPAIAKLEKKGLIMRSGSIDRQVALVKTPKQVELREIEQALFQNRRDVCFPDELSKMFAAVATVEGDPATLADLVSE